MKLRGLDIDDLIILVMLADEISVTDIGKRMHLTQPAISQRIAKIRNITGVCVAYRGKKKMVMTANGLVLACGAKEAILTLLRPLPDPFAPQVPRRDSTSAAKRDSTSAGKTDVVPARGPRPEKVRVQAGQTMADIARAHRTSVPAIMMENNLVTDRVHAGQVLRLPRD